MRIIPILEPSSKVPIGTIGFGKDENFRDGPTQGRARAMNDRFDDKPLKAEVIDMDRAQKQRGRPSTIFSERLATSIEGDPADRFLFDDYQEVVRHRPFAKLLRSLRYAAAAVALGMVSAWVVWATPGFGPQESQARLDQHIEASLARMGELESKLVQAQAHLVELTRTVELQRELLEQGEAVRRSMATRIETIDRETRNLAEAGSADRSRLDRLETSQASLASVDRRQSEKLDILEERFDAGITRVKFVQDRQDQRLTEMRLDNARSQRETFLKLSRVVDDGLDDIRRTELQSVRDRVERLAQHVWQEAGRLDGRIVRATWTQPAPE